MLFLMYALFLLSYLVKDKIYNDNGLFSSNLIISNQTKMDIFLSEKTMSVFLVQKRLFSYSIFP